MVMQLYRKKLLRGSHHQNKFCGHRHCESGNIIILVCHVILQDYLTQTFSNIMGSSPSRLVTFLQSLVVIGAVIGQI